MITIAEPKERIDKLWGKQKIREGETYRMMRYVLRVDHEDKVLLHNAVTGRLAVLERGEAEALEVPLRKDFRTGKPLRIPPLYRAAGETVFEVRANPGVYELFRIV